MTCDVLVAGGGLSGVCCALAAAREGVRVILVQDRPVLGGNASSEIRMHVVGADCHGKRGIEWECEAREGGLIEEIRLDLAVENAQRSPSMFDLLLYDKCRLEPNLQILFNATLVGVEKTGSRIERALVVQESTECRFEIAAAQFVDCTGDSRLGVEAGAAFRRGREGRAEFGETLALPESDDASLGSSLLFTASRRETPTKFRVPTWARHFDAPDLTHRLHLRDGEAATDLEYGFWWLEWGGLLDTIADNEEIRDELMAIVLGVWDHIKNSGRYPGVEYWALDWVGFVPGKRESRRLEGPYILSQSDIEESTSHRDAIAYGGWWLDLHPPQGVDAPNEPPCAQHPLDHLFDIPLRCCFSKNIENLWMAGRNISATHVAFASTRVMATCALIGQGVGVAASVAVQESVSARDLVKRDDLLHRVQQILLREDCFLIGHRNEDGADLARRSRVSASGEHPEGLVTNILSGATRAVHGQGGVPTSRALPGTQRWISSSALPAWIELRWPQAVRVGEVRVVFDTGLHRELTFSLSAHTNRNIIWGQGQPETVRDYQVLGLGTSGEWEALVTVEDNHQRLRRHRLTKSVEVTALRIRVTATHGVPEARIYEVRVYEN